MAKKPSAVIEANTTGQADKQKQLATLHLDPLVINANALQNIQGSKELELLPLIEVMKEEAAKVNKGDLTTLEIMLLAQAQVLNAMFVKSASKWASTEYLIPSKAYAAMTFKAQNLSRMTVIALANLKNPKKATFIKNTAHNQQVNFGKNFSSESSNELLSEDTKNLTKPYI